MTSGDTKRRDCYASVVVGCIRSEFEFRLVDDIQNKCVLRPFLQDVDGLIDGVSIKADSLTSVQATRQTVINPGEGFLLAVHDEDQRILWQSIEVVEDVLVLQLIDFVEDDDARRLVVLT